MGVELGGWSFGAQFGDLNNDGYLDLYLTNGYVSLSRSKSYWYDFSKSRRWQQQDYRRRGRLARYRWSQPFRLSAEEGLDQRRRRQVYRRSPGGRRDRYLRRAFGGDGRSVESRGARCGGRQPARSSADLQEHGERQENEWMEFALQGTASNRSAIGAQITLYGTASNKCSRFRVVAALRRRTIAACISA